MTDQADGTTDRTVRKIAARDGEEIAFRADDEDWIVSWHSSLTPPDGTPHGAAGLCVTGDGEIVLISADGKHWDLPAGRPEGNETWEETLRREVREEACATVVQARLLGFSRGSCLAGPHVGRVIVRSLWRAEVELVPWEPLFEIAYRRVVPSAAVIDQLTIPDSLARIVTRALLEAAFV
ncbi:MAG: NUDIX hydrolase [Thermomicrobiales bacterium]